MKLQLSSKCSTRVGIYSFIESKSKHIGFDVVVYVHFIVRSVHGPLSPRYDRDFSLIYFYLVVITWLRCTLYSLVFVAAVTQVL
jgi:hypothetical protein